MSESHKTPIPSGVSHLNMINTFTNVTLRQHSEKVDFSNAKFELLGTALTVIYESATCHRGCQGGHHVFERLSAKSYNLCCSAYNLLMSGFYDEALTLIRGIGELTNLVSLSFVEPNEFQNWLNADAKTRKNKFGPYQVRMLLEPHKDAGFLIVDKEWYGNLSEEFCHIKPDAQPNNHNESRSIAGGLYQEKGVEKVIDQLCNVAVPTAIMITRVMGFDDDFKKLSDLFVAIDPA